MDKMYEFFYMTLLIGAILLCLTTLVSGVIGKRYKKIWRKTQYGMIVITAVAMIGFITTVGM